MRSGCGTMASDRMFRQWLSGCISFGARQFKGDKTMTKAKLTGAVMATAVALAFMGSAVHAADSSTAAGAQVKYVGGNSAKGQSGRKRPSADCKDQNTWKAKGEHI